MSGAGAETGHAGAGARAASGRASASGAKASGAKATAAQSGDSGGAAAQTGDSGLAAAQGGDSGEAGTHSGDLGAGATADPVATGAQRTDDSSGALPFTGSAVPLLAAIGLLGLVAGLTIRRMTRRVIRAGA
jgi:hypothetical protein